jgi:hypothetical protein
VTLGTHANSAGARNEAKVYANFAFRQRTRQSERNEPRSERNEPDRTEGRRDGTFQSEHMRNDGL